MKKCVNEVTLVGRLFDADLAVKTVQNKESANYGKPFINGTISVATDDDCLNVVKVKYTYVTPTFASGSTNNTYSVLKSIAEGATPCVSKNGKENAAFINVSSSIASNDFYDREDNFQEVREINGGFVNVINQIAEGAVTNKFTADMLINQVRRVDPTPENRLSAPYGLVSGYVFNFRNEFIPLSLKVTNEQGVACFEQMGISSNTPAFLKLWGTIKNESVTVTKEEDGAWGEKNIVTTTHTNRDWIITGMAKVPYELGQEGVLTVAEIQKGLQDREIHKAEVKKRNDEYKASKANGGNGAMNFGAVPAATGFAPSNSPFGF